MCGPLEPGLAWLRARGRRASWAAGTPRGGPSWQVREALRVAAVSRGRAGQRAVGWAGRARPRLLGWEGGGGARAQGTVLCGGSCRVCKVTLGIGQ